MCFLGNLKKQLSVSETVSFVYLDNKMVSFYIKKNPIRANKRDMGFMFNTTPSVVIYFFYIETRNSFAYTQLFLFRNPLPQKTLDLLLLNL